MEQFRPDLAKLNVFNVNLIYEPVVMFEKEQISALKDVDPIDLWYLDLENQASSFFSWSPIPRDDHLYSTDVLQKYLKGDVIPTNLVIGFTSFEGSLLREGLSQPTRLFRV